MSRPIAAALALAILGSAAAAPAPAFAQRGDHARDRDRDHPRGDYSWRGDGDRDRGWDPAYHYRAERRHERRLGREDRVYRGHDGRYYCRRSDGTTGLVVGAIGGAILGNAIGGSTLSTLLGGAGGAVLGNSIDRGQVRCR
jgi:hypothetical protein